MMNLAWATHFRRWHFDVLLTAKVKKKTKLNLKCHWWVYVSFYFIHSVCCLLFELLFCCFSVVCCLIAIICRQPISNPHNSVSHCAPFAVSSWIISVSSLPLTLLSLKSKFYNIIAKDKSMHLFEDEYTFLCSSFVSFHCCIEWKTIRVYNTTTVTTKQQQQKWHCQITSGKIRVDLEANQNISNNFCVSYLFSFIYSYISFSFLLYFRSTYF